MRRLRLQSPFALVALLAASSGCGNYIGGSTTGAGVGCALEVNGDGEPTETLGLGLAPPQIANQELGQTFKVDKLSEVSTLDFRLQSFVPSGESFGSARVRVRIFPEATTTGTPAEDQTPLATAQRPVSEIVDATRDRSAFVRFTLDKTIGLVKGTTYWVVADADYAVSATKYVAFVIAPASAQVPDAHADGVAFYKNSSTWTKATSPNNSADRDILFRVGCQ